MAWRVQGVQLLPALHWGGGGFPSCKLSSGSSSSSSNYSRFAKLKVEILQILLLQACQCKGGVEVCGECIPVVQESPAYVMEAMEEEVEENCGC